MKNYYKILGSTVPLLFPMLVLAQGDVQAFLSSIIGVLNQVVPLLIAIAGVVFLWGVVLFVMGAGDEEKRKTGRNLIIYGLIGLAVMISFWGLVNILLATFGTGSRAIPTIPSIPPPR
ncbi:hypothetical protein IIA95_02420 [Patescibacteria group bacterium]|nr:hypothetical protein [Patescibacteria group bacterium]